MKRKLFIAATVLFGVIFLVSAAGLGFVLYRYHQADEVYEDIRDKFVMEVDPFEEDEPTDPPVFTSDPDVHQTTPATTASTTPGIQTAESTGPVTDAESATGPAAEPTTEPTTEPVTEPAPVTTEPPKKTEVALPKKAPIKVDFAGLQKVNADVIGWLYAPGTPINYPVVQSKDNADYLHADLYGKYLYSGTLFADCRSGPFLTDQNLIIYGHTMSNGTMFGTLYRYKNQSYYDAHPYMIYLTPQGNYRVDLFAAVITESTSSFYYPNFAGASGFQKTLDSAIAKSTFVSNFTVSEDDHIIMLSSCDYTFNDARYIVMGKLTPIS